MSLQSFFRHRKINRFSVLALTILLCLFAIFTFVQAKSSASVTDNDPPFNGLSGSLNSGATVPLVVPHNNTQPRNINFSLTVMGTSPISLTVVNGAGTTVWSDKAEGGETLWGNTSLTQGNNIFYIKNVGTTAVDFNLSLFDIADTPYSWVGEADPAGVNSQINLNFPQSGLYQFDFGINTGERYEFNIDDDYIQKTVTSDTVVTYYVEAGVHALEVVQDSGGNNVEWQVDIAYAGQAADSLPYAKNSDDINTETLPLFLANAVEANLVITATGAANATLDVDILDGSGASLTSIMSATVQTGETFWMTFDLPVGNHFIKLTSNNDVVSYDLVLDELPTVNYDWLGVANDSGENSHARLVFDQSGLYTFDFSLATGRHQFMLDLEDSTSHIQKTVESSADDVTLYVPAGTHDLMLVQDTTAGADWQVDIALDSAVDDSLPYGKAGGNLGGAGNDFAAERLPISLDADTTVNMSIETTGDTTDELLVEVYQPGSATPDYTLPLILGTEKIWTNFDLGAGVNYLNIVAAGGNASIMTYDLEISGLPSPGTIDWAGLSLADGDNTVIKVDFPSTGLYHFEIASDPGFANLVVNSAQARPNNLLTTSYDMMVTAGIHDVSILQDTAYAQTEWSASIAPATAVADFFTFNGSLTSGEVVTPTYEVTNGTREFNFALSVAGDGPVDLHITDGNGGDVADTLISVNDGETVWGTGTLEGINKFMLQNNGATDASIELVLYDLPTAGYDWMGVADAAGEMSHIRVIFDESGLYDFDSSTANGRFQFIVNGEFIQKTVEDNTNYDVTYFVPAGTHDLYIDQGSTDGIEWGVNISDVGNANDSLPYTKDGGNLDSEFDTEWLTIDLATATQVNMEVSLDGTAGNTATIMVYKSSGTEIAAAAIDLETAETTWSTFNLPAGTNRVKVMANGGNTAAVTYDLTIDELPNPTYLWEGNTAANGQDSHIRVNFDTAGLYNFDMTSNGRYQIQVNDSFILKAVEDGGTNVTYYIPAGTHDLMVTEDTTTGADWTVNITGPGDANDSLSYNQTGGNLGANQFVDEWLPINLGAETQVNIELTVIGGTADSLQLMVKDALTGNTNLLTMDQVYGGETVWNTVNLSSGAARFYLIAAGGNSAALEYDLSVHAVEQPTTTWSGISYDGDSLESVVTVDFSSDGVYNFALTADPGAANLVLDSAMPRPNALGGTSYDMFVSAGEHEVYVIQDKNYGVTEWEATITAVTTPGAMFFEFEGTLANGEIVVPEYAAFENIDFNFEVIVAGDDINLDVMDASTASIWDAQVYNGETVWGTGTLTTGTNSFEIENLGTNPVNVILRLYYLPTAGYADWLGVANSAGENSNIRVTFPQDGLYTFDSTASNGRFQFLVESDLIQKTVETGNSVTYFVPAGTWNLYLDQDSTAGAEWAVDISDVGNANDSLPYAKIGGDIGDSINNDFDQEWLTINLAEATEVNNEISLTGTNGDSATVYIYDSSSVIISTTVYANETHWITYDLPAGTSRIQIVADGGNTDPLSYDLVVDALPTAGTDWAGIADSLNKGNESHVRVIFPEAGLYTFTYTNTGSGRYQFAVNEQFIQKTVEATGTVTYYIPAGTWDILIDQDSSNGAEWGIDISDVNATNDSLPTMQVGGEIGGAGNDFAFEWIPVHLGTDTLVNIALSLTGDITDSVRLEVWDTVTQTMVLEPVYGTEIVWANTELPANARLYLVAANANANALSYELNVYEIPEPTYSWSGTSLANGVNSDLQMNFPVNGTYLVQVESVEGYATLQFDNGTSRSLNGFYNEYETPITAGLHTLQTLQSNLGEFFPTTSWTITMTLVAANPPQITAIAPTEGKVGDATAVTITGLDFQQNANVQLTNGTMTYTLSSISVTSLTEIMATVPGTVPLGTYDLVVTNPDNQWATLADAFTVIMQDAPVVTAIAPDQAYVNVATAVTITGDDFRDGATVKLVSGTDEYALTGVIVDSLTHISATVPSTVPLGTYDVVVTNEDGQSDTLTDGFTVIMQNPPVVTAITPDETYLGMATAVTITGDDFRDGATVKLVSGTDEYVLTGVTVDSLTQISATVPNNVPIGTYDLVVTNEDDQSDTLADAFTVNQYHIFLPLVVK